MKKVCYTKVFFTAVLFAVILAGCDFTLLPGPNIVSLHLSDLSAIPAPAKGGTPLLEFDTAEYTGVIVWRQSGSGVSPFVFQDGGIYRADIHLTPKKEFTFNGFIGTFFHRKAERVTQAISANSADVVIEFSSLPFSDVEFVSLSGTRDKVFNMVLDSPGQDVLHELEVSGNASGSFTATSQSGQSSMTTTYPSVTITNRISFILPVWELFNPGSHTVAEVSGSIQGIATGTIHNGQGNPIGSQPFSRQNVSLDLEITNSENIIQGYEYAQEETFSSPTPSLPAAGFTADRNVFHFLQLVHTITLSGEQSRAIANVSNPSSYRWPYPELTGSISLYHIFRQQSREFFYRYRTLTISYAPNIPIYRWQGGPLVDHFEFNGDTNTLTAFLKEYNDKPLGEIFSFHVIAPNGDVLKKSVGIGD